MERKSGAEDHDGGLEDRLGGEAHAGEGSPRRGANERHPDPAEDGEHRGPDDGNQVAEDGGHGGQRRHRRQPGRERHCPLASGRTRVDGRLGRRVCGDGGWSFVHLSTFGRPDGVR